MLGTFESAAGVVLPQGAAWLAVVASYLIGAIPFGLVVARMRGVDLRKVGSGNIGATNAMRALGKPLGYTVFALDVLKGAIPAAVGHLPFASEGDAALTLRVLCGFAAVVGHCFPLYLAFKGGKGVATGCGALIALDPWIFVGGGVLWLAVFGATRFVSLASIAMGVAFPVVAIVCGDPAVLVAAAALLALLILVRHRSNIARLIAGTEPRSGGKKRVDVQGAGHER